MPEQPTRDQMRALVETCPKARVIRYPGPWGSTIHMRVPLGRQRPEPDWEALLTDLADPLEDDLPG